MKKLKEENQILCILAFLSLSIGLWENFRQLWLQDNGFSALQISQITSIGTLASVLGIIFVSKKITLDKLKGFMSFVMVIKFFNLVNLFYLNGTMQNIFINSAIVIDIMTSYLIITCIYPLITIFVKNNTIYSKRKLTEYLFRDVGILVGGFLIGKSVVGVLVTYNVCLYISIVFLVGAMLMMFGMKSCAKVSKNSKPAISVIQYVVKNKLLKNYCIYSFIGAVAMTTGLGLKMLTLTNYLQFSESIATNYLVVIGLVCDLIGILALKYLTPKNDYLTITIKFGIRFLLYTVAFMTDNLFVTGIAITWSLLIGAAYENVCDGYYINSVESEYQLMFTNFRYMIKYVGEAIGLFFCGLMYEKGLRYMFGLSAFFMIFQISLAYKLIYMRQHPKANVLEKIQKCHKKKQETV